MDKKHAHDMHIISIVTRNSLRVLQRISGLFSAIVLISIK